MATFAKGDTSPKGVNLLVTSFDNATHSKTITTKDGQEKQINLRWVDVMVDNREPARANETDLHVKRFPDFGEYNGERQVDYSFPISQERYDEMVAAAGDKVIHEPSGRTVLAVKGDVALPFKLRDKQGDTYVDKLGKDGKPLYSNLSVKNFSESDFDLTPETLKEAFARRDAAKAAAEADKHVAAEAEAEQPKSDARKQVEAAAQEADAKTEAQAEGPELG